MTIVAGPNGSGKTTFIENVFASEVSKSNFLNADHIASEIFPENVSSVPIQAGKVFFNRLESAFLGEENVFIESTLSGSNALKRILQKAKSHGFTNRLIFLWIRDVDLCDFRVKARVSLGGHNIPTETIRRRGEFKDVAQSGL